MNDRLKEQVKRLYQPLRRRHDALRESLLASLETAAKATPPTNRKHIMKIIKITFASGIAAAALIAASLLIVNHTAPTVSAAEALQRVLEDSEAYRGWMHVTMIWRCARKSSWPPLTKPAAGDSQWRTVEVDVFRNTIDGAYAMDVLREGMGREVEYIGPLRQELVQYSSATNKILIKRLTPMDAQAKLDQGFGQSTAKGLINQLQYQRPEQRFQVAKSRDGANDRFDLSFQDAKHFRSITIWADPANNRIRKMSSQFNKDTATSVYEYDARPINDIYDLGVPRDAKIVEEKEAATSGSTSQPTTKTK
ncbi:MAG: hypothetical protein WC869_08020 [Phycisphaerae bacterium]|jgi:hypothetical protein